jgi:hypothetical protein
MVAESKGIKMEAVGNNGRMTIDGDRLIISRKGTGLLTAMNLGLQGDKIIPISQITAVELRPPGALTAGYFRLSINGRDPIGGLTEAVRDENAVLMSKPALAAFEALRDTLMEKIGRPTAVSAMSVADEIEKLAALRDKGILTEEEFTAKKRQLLA